MRIAAGWAVGLGAVGLGTVGLKAAGGLRMAGVAPGRFATVAGTAGTSWWAVRLARLRRSVDRHYRYWNIRSQQPGELCYVALGDSATQGIGASRPERGYVGLVASRIEAVTGRSVRVVNLSRSGARIDDLRDRQLPRLAAMPVAPHIVTVGIGGNDVRDRTASWDADVRTVLDALPAGAIVADVPDFGGGPSLRHGRQAARVVRTAVAVRPLRLVDLEAATRDGMGRASYAADGFHPGNRGHRIWADAFWPAVVDALEDEVVSAGR
jgi:lysophospholipase L1-like esterase